MEDRGDVVPLPENAVELIPEEFWVVSKQTQDSDWLEFCFYEFYIMYEDGPRLVVPLLRGQGPTGYLRECRHTYWGRNGQGYIFYPRGKNIRAALDWLEQHFDLG